MKIRVIWYDFAGNERHQTYENIVDVIVADDGNLWLFDENIDTMSIRGALAVYAAGEWHHIEKIVSENEIAKPAIFKASPFTYPTDTEF